MAKIKLPKKKKKNSQHGNILNTIKKNLSRPTPRDKIEPEVIHISIKTDVSP